MTNKPGKTEAPVALLHDCSSMDGSVVQRLRATVVISQEWAEQTLDVLIRLDDDLQAFDALIKQNAPSLPLPEDISLPEPGNRIPGVEEIARQAEQSVQRLRNGVRDVMMSMQLQDVIGQAVERAASALEKRAAVLGRGGEEADDSFLPTTEIAEIHCAYRNEDDLHRSGGADEEEHKAAA